MLPNRQSEMEMKEYWKSLLKNKYCYIAKILLYKWKYWCTQVKVQSIRQKKKKTTQSISYF